MPESKAVKVVIVDDSATVQLNIRQLLEADPEFHIVGLARDGEEALRAITASQPDVVIMDISMPRLDGINATRQIMTQHPVPIVIVSTHSQNPEISFQAMEAGALTVLDKPPGPGMPGREKAGAELRSTLRQMAQVQVVRRWTLGGTGRQPIAAGARAPLSGEISRLRSQRAAGKAPRPQIVGIGASTGGPPTLLQVLKPLPVDFPAPILVVQHIAPGFLSGLQTWLEHEIALPVQVAVGGQTAMPGQVYLAPDGAHLGISPSGRIIISNTPPEGGHQPAVAHLFRSLADSYGARTVGVLLTGMGRDGAHELGLIKTQGGVTIAQDKATSVVHGMPGEAIRLQAATHVLNPPDIATTLLHLFH